MNKTKTHFIFFLVTFVILNITAQAQDFGAGAIAGFNFSQVDGDRFGGYNKVGLNLGIFVNRKLNEHWYAKGELLMSQKGSRKKTASDSVLAAPEIFILKFTYLELPLILSYKKRNFSFELGPSIGVKIRARRDTGLGFKDDPDINRTELALNLGINYRITETWSFNIRHSNSLLRIGNPYSGGIYLISRNGLYNRLFTMSVRYTLSKE
jgi:hypothetical protein